MSLPWNAPELEAKKKPLYDLFSAKKVDVYCFGMLCFWVLFWEHLEENGTPTGGGGLVRQTWRIMHSVIRKALGGEVWSIDIESLRNLNRQTAENNKTLKYALEFADFAGNEFSCTLHKLFERTLAYDPDQRGDFKEISDMLLNRKSNDVPAKPTKNTKEGMMSIPKPSDFKISQSLQTLCQGDYRLRRHILQCLVEEFDTSEAPEEQSKLESQLAFCTRIGLGTQRFPNEAIFEGRRWTANIPASDLQDEIEASRLQAEPFDERLRKMAANGVVQPVSHAEDYSQATPQNQKLIRILLREEITDMEKALGKTHAAVLNLKYCYGGALPQLKKSEGLREEKYMNDGKGQEVAMKDPLHEELIELWTQMIQDLESDPNYGPKNLTVLITKAYLAVVTHMGNMDYDSLDSARTLARKVYWDLMETEQGRDHVVAVILGRVLAQNAEMCGHTNEAIKLSRQAREATVRIFGEEHANAYLLLEVESVLLMKQGKLEDAENLLQAGIKGLGKAIGADTMPMLQPMGTLLGVLKMRRKFEQANEVNNLCMNILLKNGFAPNHPALMPVRLAAIDILMEQERYAEAAKKSSEYISEIEKMFPFLRKDQLPSLRVHKAGTPPPPVVMDTMQLYILHLIRVVTWVTQDSPDADEELLKFLTRANDGLGPKPWDNLDPRKGRSGSALSLAMEEELCMFVELLMGLGAKNLQDGAHYKKAIEVARRNGLVKSAALLEEHHALCFAKLTSDPFTNRQDLKEFWQGDWAGCYLYHNGGLRKDPKGRRTLRFDEIHDSDDRPDTVLLTGELKDEQGEWVLKGEAQVSGSVLYHQWLKEGTANHSIEYCGTVNTERAAVGGSWGPRGLTETTPMGTFFYFKS